MRLDSTRTNGTTSHRALYGLLLTAAATSALVFLGCGPDTPGGSGAPQGSASSAASGGGSDGSGGAGGEGGSVTGGGGSGGSGGSWDPEAGWTDFPESADTQKVYVSSSGGDDNNDGLSEAKAVKTIAKGKSILRAGMPDRLLLKRGDVWNEPLGTWSKSGKSATEPLVVSTYGTGERPLLKTGNKGALYAASNTTVNYVAFIGLHLYAHTRNPDDGAFVGPEGEEGVRWLANTDGLLFEDMYVQFYEGPNFTVQGTVPNTNSIKNVKLRRNVIADSYNTTGHSQGIYAQQVTNLLIEENLFDHNGWHDKVGGAEKTIFNHNMYINATCDGLVVLNNISVRAASHGLQARPGGTVSGNLFVDDPIALSFGLVLGSDPKAGGVTGEVSDNIILSSADIDPVDLPRGMGMQLGNIQSAIIENNIIAHDKSAKPYGNAIDFSNNGVGIHNLTVQNNIIYDWRGNLRFDSAANYLAVRIKGNFIQAPNDPTLLATFTGGISSEITFEDNVWASSNPEASWFSVANKNQSFSQFTAASGETGGTSKVVTYASPELKISDYNKSIGGAADFYAFLAEARKQARGHYLYEYTTAAPMAFIRDGFKTP
jgi:hypothetical protein